MIVNSTQKALVYSGYYLNTFARIAGRNIEWLTRATERRLEEKVQQAVTFILAASLTAVCFFPALGCYTAASLVGNGRFELLDFSNGVTPLAKREIRVMGNNCCFQDPWSGFTGGVVPPFERVQNCASRIEALVNAIGEEDVDLFLGQEFESVGAQDEAIRLLRQKGFLYFARDLGATEPVRNNSGTFVASKLPFSFKFAPYAIEDREGLAKWSAQGAMILKLNTEAGEMKFINVHLNYGDEEGQPARNRQLQNYVVPELSDATVLIGDLNFDTSKVSLAQAGVEGCTNAIEGQPSCTDDGKHVLHGKARERCVNEAIDGLVYKTEGRVHVENPRLKQLRLSGELLTDHSAVLATVGLR